MKLLLILPVLLSIIVVGGVNLAFADWVEFNHEVNSKSEHVYMLGIGNGPLESVYVQILDNEGEIIFEDNAVTDHDNDFGRTYHYSDLGGFGQYTAIVTYDGIDTEFDFELLGRNSQVAHEEINIDQKDQDIERLQMEIQKQNNRIAELENENLGLKKKIAELKDEIIKKSEEFYVTITNQMNWFFSQTTN